MSWRTTISVAALVLLSCAATSAQDDTTPPPPPVTTAEESDYQRTSSHDEVESFLATLDELSDRITLDSIGTTNEGRDIPLAIIASPPIESPEQAAKSNKLVVLLFGNIHAGEVCGKEAILHIARELCLAKEAPLLDDLIVCLVPNYNADGNEDMAHDHRPGQDGPDEMGTRHNAQGLDLNRDYVKLDAPETRALVRFMNEWDPAVIVDTHTTNGSHHRYTLTYQGPKHPAGDAEVIEYVRDAMLPAIDEAFEDDTEYHAFFYGNFANDHTRWTTYPAEPRYGAGYRGMRNRITILSEAYSYSPFRDRVVATEAFCNAVLDYSAANRSAISKLLDAADARTTAAGEDPDGSAQLPVRVRVTAFPDKVTVLGFDEYDEEGNRTEPGEPRDYEVELVNLFEPTESVSLPWAYLIDQDLEHIVHHLQLHGVEINVLREDIELDAEVYVMGEHTRAERAFEGHNRITNLDADAIPRTIKASPGTYVVFTAQKLGTLAAYMLEPRASDGLVAWNFLDDHLEPGADYPIIRLPARQPLTHRSARPLPEDRPEPRRITYDDLYGDKRINLNGSPIRSLRWLDNEHFAQHKQGEWRKVHAVSGRSEPFEPAPVDDIAANLERSPWIDTADAKRLAGPFRSLDPDAPGRVFSHASDLFFAKPNGSDCVRLTTSPEPDELASLSDDGLFVAFIRDNDLYVVDTQTATQRPVTSGATDAIRNGKASWLYYEELFRRNWRAFWWSSDSRHIAYLQIDSTAVPFFTIVDDSTEPQTVEVTRYPRPGDRNPHARLFIAPAIGGAPREVDLSAYDDGAFVISSVNWSEDGSRLYATIQNRQQTWLDLLEINPSNAKHKKLLRETTGAWVVPHDRPRALKDKSLLWISERDGYRHLYRLEANGTVRAQLTQGDYELRRLLLVDEDQNAFWFLGTRDGHLVTNLYRGSLDEHNVERLTLEPGSHSITLSPDGSMFIDAVSDHQTPTTTTLRTASGAPIRTLDTNPVYELDNYELGRMELFEIESEKGVTLDAALIYPPDFDPAKTYPIWLRTYAGPHAPTLRNTWSAGRTFDQMLAAQNIVMLLTDPYPASARGAQSAWTAYRQLGVRELEDLEEVVHWVKQFEWADPDRIGMSGHSYGGFMTSYAMTHSKSFAAGIAGAPVTDWREYDTIYTERYMDTPQNNPDGYAKTSVIDAAKHLHGRLLLLHGAIDDNVHMRNSTRLIDALRKAEKQFEFFTYPGFRHGIRNSHYNKLFYDFVLDAMRPDATSSDEATE